MPNYTFSCLCGNEQDEIVPMAERDTFVLYCEKCLSEGYICGPMKRETVYAINTATNEASVWPQKNDALVPTDPVMEVAYRRKGWLVSDGMGGETVKVESEKHFQRMLKQQGLKMSGDYEKPNRSLASNRPKRRKHRDTPGAKAAKEKARAALRDKGINVYK